MIKVREAIVVEGRYDKNTLAQIVDAPILETSGFGIMNDKAQLSLLRRVAKARGLIVFTDSDGAGFVIRNYLKGCIPAEQLKHAYIPEIAGKERRKRTPGKEGILGVEGMDRDTILEALRRAGASFDEGCDTAPHGLSKQDMMELGLSGGKDSSTLRIRLQKKLGLPAHMSSNALLQALNLLYDKAALCAVLSDLEKENG